MIFDLNAAAQQFKPWDLSITIDGVNYQTTPFSLQHRQTLRTLENKSEEEGYAFFESLFAGEQKPDVRSWDEDRAGAVLGAILAYKTELSKKNAQVAGEIVAAQLGK
jgi:hypothetical protein